MLKNYKQVNYVFLLLAKKTEINLQMEVQEDDHFSVTGLEEGMFDVVVQDVHLISTDRCVAEAI